MLSLFTPLTIPNHLFAVLGNVLTLHFIKSSAFDRYLMDKIVNPLVDAATLHTVQSASSMISQTITTYAYGPHAPVALVSVAYDHLLTLDQELTNIWSRNSETSQGYLNKFTFILNRYVAEAVTAYTAFVLSGQGSGILDNSVTTIFIGITQFAIILRVYHLWDKRKRMTVILFSGFFVSISSATVLAILTVIKVQPVTFFFPIINTCGFMKIPSTLPYTLGSLLLFDTFLIAVAVLNAFEAPHHTHAEVFKSLHRDGARLFLVLFVLRLVTLLVSIIGNQIASLFSASHGRSTPSSFREYIYAWKV
ncbi:hypothetical protein D9758_012970 [Tetrapyrgos nigripes]|uniref:DUF6533 domain-containing protein n=1 Tax=Tetrapyrgos nigripes TaxID=182062 RepID=A0A8H5CMC3_9AGAR|nr:hypothetical protein D9758_012970 [Tetrapyrgos nigripes]